MPWSSALAALRAEGWLNEDALAEALPDLATAQPQDILGAAMDLDLKKVGAACLPDNINRADSIKLQGPLVLQLVDATDIAQPTKFKEHSADRPGRLLRLKLTDGTRTAVGVEYYPIPGLKSEALCPGVKFKVSNAVVRCGILLLDSKSVQLLGGRVESLAETWELQQRYGDTAERGAEGKGGASGGAVAERPMPFKPFDPTAPRHPKNVEKKAQEKKAQEAVPPSPAAGGSRTAGSAAAAPGAAAVNPARSVVNAPSSASSAPFGAKTKLLERLAKHEQEGGGRRGRGRGPRRGRRRFDGDSGEDDGKMTLEEWEAKKKAGINGGAMVASGGAFQLQQQQQQQLMGDEELARRLQAEMDLEDAQLQEMNAHAVGVEEDGSFNYFYGRVEADTGGRCRGGGGRGGGGGQRQQDGAGGRRQQRGRGGDGSSNGSRREGGGRGGRESCRKSGGRSFSSRGGGGRQSRPTSL